MHSPEQQVSQSTAKPVPTVRAGIYVLAAVLLFEFISVTLFDWSAVSNVTDPSTSGLLPLAWLGMSGGILLIVGPGAFLLYMTRLRYLWALVLLIGLTAAGVLGYLYDVARHGIGDSPARYMDLAVNIGNLVGITFLLNRQSLSWFRIATPITRRDAEGNSKRPWPVKIAITLYGIAIALDLLSEQLTGFARQHHDPMYSIWRELLLLIAIPALVLKLVALYNTYQRRNWARLLFAILALVTGYLAVVDIEATTPLLRSPEPQWILMALVRGALPGLLGAASLVLLFAPASNKWFRTSRSAE